MRGIDTKYSYSKGVTNFRERQIPNDMYGAAKASAHYFLEVNARRNHRDFIWAIIPSTFGEYRDDNNILTYTICLLLRGEKPLYGNLSQMWDFLYVSDVARALRLIGESGQAGKIYGIGSGVYLPLRSYIEQIRDLIDPVLPLGIGEVKEMSAKTFSSCVNIDELQRDTGYRPEVSFEDGIMRTIRFWRERLRD